MSVYIALLRGINVGGKNKIKMDDLKRAFESSGFSRVQTFIQSGNVLFESNEKEEHLEKIIMNKIESVFGFSTEVILRTKDELVNIISNCPFPKETITQAESASDAECLYVSLLADAPSPKGLEILKAYKNESDDYHVSGRDIYLLLRSGIRNSRLAGHLQNLDTPSTVRNWKTLNKLTLLMWK
jgi:uncharacterized protein (DUF1697 family)